MAIIGRVRGTTPSRGAIITTHVQLNLNPNLLKEATALGLKLMPKIVQQFKAAIVRRSPFRFGTNRRSIMTAKINDRTYSVFSTSGYGGYLEFGHKTRSGKMVAPRPYFRQGAAYMSEQISKLTRPEQLDSPIPDPGKPLMFGPAAKAV